MLFKAKKSDGDSASQNKKGNSSSRGEPKAANKQSTATFKKDVNKIAKSKDDVKRQTGKNLEKCLKPGRQAHELEKEREEEARIADELYEVNRAGFGSGSPNPGTRMVNGKVRKYYGQQY